MSAESVYISKADFENPDVLTIVHVDTITVTPEQHEPPRQSEQPDKPDQPKQPEQPPIATPKVMRPKRHTVAEALKRGGFWVADPHLEMLRAAVLNETASHGGNV